MRPFSKIPLILIGIFILITAIFLSLKSGDLLLGYLADSLGFKISYKNNCGLASAFIFKMIHLESVSLKALDNPLKIECKNANIWFDYSKFWKKRAIGLHCQFSQPLMLGESQFKEKDTTDFLAIVLNSILGKTTDFQYDDIFCDLLMYGNTAEIHSFRATSPEVILEAKGLATGDNQINLDVNILFSPEFIAGFEEEAKLLLEEKTDGWMKFHIRIKTAKEGPLLQLEGDTFRLTIG